MANFHNILDLFNWYLHDILIIYMKNIEQKYTTKMLHKLDIDRNESFPQNMKDIETLITH